MACLSILVVLCSIALGNALLSPVITKYEDGNCTNMIQPATNVTLDCMPYKETQSVRIECETSASECPGRYRWVIYSDANCAHREESTITPSYPIGRCVPPFTGGGYVVGECIPEVPFQDLPTHTVEYVAGPEESAGVCRYPYKTDIVYRYGECYNGYRFTAVNVSDSCADQRIVSVRRDRFLNNDCSGGIRPFSGPTWYATDMCSVMQGSGYTKWCDNECEHDGPVPPHGDDGSSGLKTWQIALIAVGGALLLLFIAIALCRCSAKRSATSAQEGYVQYGSTV
eukprot:TRINITY_DN5296_c0_g1_i1.p1 TRINITY_DN5296_c0_g1~~TRINITY_DN5296_c0_g1_i1.p1  ORF type:complete len:284 (+),score=43.86 TRINITY_DN5296_c0_g1_i1:38-889(+)